MHLAVERGVPQEERKTATAGLTDWDAARMFLEVARCGSFRSAADRLGLSINAVRRRIDDFERQTGTTLFTRDVHGARLTEDGARVVSAVERMEAAAFELIFDAAPAQAELGKLERQHPMPKVPGEQDGDRRPAIDPNID